MISRAVVLASVLALSLAACSRRESDKSPEPPAAGEPADLTAGPQAPAPAATPDGGLQGGTDQWKTVASAADQDRIARLPDAWREATLEADDKAVSAQIDALGLATAQDAALTGALQPAPGAYRCRTIKIGSMTGDGLAFVSYPWFTCTVELTPGGDLVLTKTGGSQRTRGLLYPDPQNPARLIYVGAQAWGGDEKGFPAYGQIPERDQVGVVERLGRGRYRLVLPWPKQEAKLEILEIRK